ncbi:hypothetical protein EVAR_52006_1 [Eumeta japonica]|uniref:Uncharacterized protein n=1 Tax=Eumeta variegata TaxID=151549 RepID=A0A4C1Y2N8_EUMVA|nr:hypothetical protein EVAR_52006_1 [Eumeta japonica]
MFKRPQTKVLDVNFNLTPPRIPEKKKRGTRTLLWGERYTLIGDATSPCSGRQTGYKWCCVTGRQTLGLSRARMVDPSCLLTFFTFPTEFLNEQTCGKLVKLEMIKDLRFQAFKTSKTRLSGRDRYSIPTRFAKLLANNSKSPKALASKALATADKSATKRIRDDGDVPT